MTEEIREKALSLYTTPSSGQFGTGDYEPAEVDTECVEAYLKGYQQAETDIIRKADEFIGTFVHPEDMELKRTLLEEFHKSLKGEQSMSMVAGLWKGAMTAYLEDILNATH